MTTIATALEAVRQAVDATFRAEMWLGSSEDHGEDVAAEQALCAARTAEDAAWLAYNALLQATPLPPPPTLTYTEQLAVKWVQAQQRVLRAERDLAKQAAARDVVEQAVIEVRLETAELYSRLTVALLKP